MGFHYTVWGHNTTTWCPPLKSPQHLLVPTLQDQNFNIQVSGRCSKYSDHDSDPIVSWHIPKDDGSHSPEPYAIVELDCLSKAYECTAMSSPWEIKVTLHSYSIKYKSGVHRGDSISWWPGPWLHSALCTSTSGSLCDHSQTSSLRAQYILPPFKLPLTGDVAAGSCPQETGSYAHNLILSPPGSIIIMN